MSCECLTAYDIGLPEYGNQIAYWNPGCPEHGETPDECELCESLTCHHDIE